MYTIGSVPELEICILAMLNEEYDWKDVRYPINRHISYDVDLSFVDRPDKELLPLGTVLYRLDFPIVFGIFTKVWWMKEAAYYRIFERAGSVPSALRQEWQNSLALRKPAAVFQRDAEGNAGKLGRRIGEAGTRTQVLVILTLQPVYAWVGIASPLFDKCGGEEQVYLPNLAQGFGPDRSPYARLLRTGTLPTS